MVSKAMLTSDRPDWQTPQNVIDVVLQVFGGAIDLDPAAEPTPPHNVPATTHFTPADDGLYLPWGGRVYCNPPYGREIGRWATKARVEYETGQTSRLPAEIILLLPARVDTAWWRELRNFPVCFVRGRLKFVGAEWPAPFPSALMYLGPNVGAFTRHAEQLGDVYGRTAWNKQEHA